MASADPLIIYYKQKSAIGGFLIFSYIKYLYPSHLLQVEGMGNDSITHALEFVVLYIKLFTGGFYNLANGRVVYM